jgi:hypothetical protein
MLPVGQLLLNFPIDSPEMTGAGVTSVLFIG